MYKKTDLKKQDINKINPSQTALGKLFGEKVAKLNYKDIFRLIHKRRKIVKIKPEFWEKEFGDREKYWKAYLRKYESLIVNKISSNNSFSKAISELKRVYSEGDKFLEFQILLCNDFIKEFTIDFIQAEMDNIIQTHKNLLQYSLSNLENKTVIEGDLLKFDIKNKIFTTNWLSVNRLIERIGSIIYTFSIILRMKNSEWLEAFMNHHQTLERDKTITTPNRLGKNVVSKNKTIGRPKKFNNQDEFHNKIESISGWQSLSKTKLSKTLGYKSSSGLNELLKSTGWTLPR